jgi:hypothetical protein
MTTSRRRAGFALLFLAAASLGSACLSPTLPLPPPAEPESIRPAEAEGDWIVTGTCVPGALITVFNEETGRGAVIEDIDYSGRYSVAIGGTRCDSAWISQETGDEGSGRTVFVLQETTGSIPDDSSACK